MIWKFIILSLLFFALAANLSCVLIVFDKMASPGGNFEFCWNPPSEKTLAKSSYEGFSLCHFGGEVKYDDLVSNKLIRVKFQP